MYHITFSLRKIIFLEVWALNFFWGFSTSMEKQRIALAAFAQISIFTIESTPIYDWNFQFEGQEKLVQVTESYLIYFASSC